MSRLNKLAIRIYIPNGTTREDACYMASAIASQLQLNVCFNWNDLLPDDFIVTPDETFTNNRKHASAYKRLTELMDQLELIEGDDTDEIQGE